MRKPISKREIERRNVWHAIKGTVYHNNDHCQSGHRIKGPSAAGTGGKELCGECAALMSRGVPRIMKDWDRTPDGQVHSILLPENATAPLSQYQ